MALIGQLVSPKPFQLPTKKPLISKIIIFNVVMVLVVCFVVWMILRIDTEV
jgi:hypothetical protein